MHRAEQEKIVSLISLKRKESLMKFLADVPSLDENFGNTFFRHIILIQIFLFPENSQQ